MAESTITAERLRQILSYDPETGLLRWRETRGSRAVAGEVAGCCRANDRFVVVRVDDRLYLAHRLAWLHTYGKWPERPLRHINGDKTDNRISNLEERTKKVKPRREKKPRNVPRAFNGPLAAERLRELLHYDPETGKFTWRAYRGARAKQGESPGFVNPLGYIEIRIDKKLYRAHRLAWLYSYGEWPERNIDHANGDPSDNRLSNLRLCSQSENAANSRRKSTNSSGVKGVYWNKQAGKWRARITKNYKTIEIGQFDRLEDAAAAYARTAEKVFGQFARADH